MMQNIGSIDRAVRLIAGIGLLSLVFVGPQTWWGLLGIIPLVTALVGWCPPYALLGINTCAARRTTR
jgi:hypothetical protein